MKEFYRALIAFIVAICAIFPCKAQSSSDIRISSYNTFIYKLNDTQAEVLYKDLWNLDSTFLTQLYDVYPIDSTYRKKLPFGHYVFVKAVGIHVQTELKSVNNLELNVLNNHRDLILVAQDSAGYELKNLTVKIGRRNIQYHEPTHTYRIKKSNTKGIVSVGYNGHTSYFELSRRYNNGFLTRTGNKILVGVDKLVSPIGRLFRPKPLTGYLAFNKPIYKPDDTVKLKAYLTTLKGKSFAKETEVFLVSNYPSVRKKIGTILPVRKGSYPFEFFLHDSLSLLLDETYEVQLSRKSRELISGSFKYEQYELKQNTYTVQKEIDSDKKTSVLLLKGTDSNNMPLYDVKVEILLKTVAIRKYYNQKVFVPDTLWFHETKLEPSGETRIILPDTLFPAADLDYSAEVTFLNTEKERTTKTISLELLKEKLPVSLALQNDSLLITAFEGFESDTVFILETVLGGDNVFAKHVTLPYRELITPAVTSYKLRYRKLVEGLSLEWQPDNLYLMSNRTADSLFISTQNPRRISFRYFVFKNQQLIESGESESLNVKRKANKNDVYYVSIQYIWAAKSQNQEFTIPFNQYELNVEVAHQPTIFPGQQLDFDITVKDAAGEPVEDADVTAYAITKKFTDATMAHVPDLSESLKQRSIINVFSIKDTRLFTNRYFEKSFWKKTLGLDSLVFYNLLDPDSGYYEFRRPAATAQIAPFIASYRLEKAVVIYVDNIPVYYQGVEARQPYSVAVKPGTHTIKLRIAGSLITVNNVWVASGQKLIFSVDEFNLPKQATKIEMPNSLTPEEAKALGRYFIAAGINNRYSNAYLQQGDRFHLLEAKQYRYNMNMLMGPFYPGTMTFVPQEELPIELSYEAYFNYEFKGNIIKLRQYDAAAVLQSHSLWNNDQEIPLNDEVLTADSIKAYWQAKAEADLYNFKRFPDFSTSKIMGRLTLDVQQPEPIVATFILNLNDPNEYYVFPGTIMGQYFSPSHYQAIMLLPDKRYLMVDSVIVKGDGSNYYLIKDTHYKPADSLSFHIMKTLADWSTRKNYYGETYIQGLRAYDMQRLRNLYYQTSGHQEYGHTIMGQLTSAEDGATLPGVSVVVKGTAIGTVTDGDGLYSLSCPPNAVLVFSFIGLKTQEISVTTQSSVDIVMEGDATMLNEVVVVAGGLTVQRRELGNQATVTRGVTKNAMAGLSGKVPGLLVSAVSSGVNPNYRVVLRGQRSLLGNSKALVIIDGRISSAEEIEKIDEESITAVEVLSAEAATALYGSQAANGVLLLSTKKGATLKSLRDMAEATLNVGLPEELPGNALRKNFRDYAFWKPDLITNQQGEAKFDATFPDDVTGWNVHVLAMASKRRAGQASSVIRSYKPMTAQIAQPQFLIEGDQASAVGKITAYSAEKIQVKRILKVNDRELKNGMFDVMNSKTDSIQLSATNLDSIAVEYTASHEKYKDGELRKIPVFRKGTLEAVGTFMVINRDTTFAIPASQGKLFIHAEADVAEVLLAEIDYLRHYRYECNEQMASRLLGLLSAKQIRKFRGETFRYDREIEKVVRKLISNQNHDGGWSWWNSGKESDPWVTLHVANSLKLAKEIGDVRSFYMPAVIEYFGSALAFMSKHDYLNTLKFLLEQKQPVSIKPIADSTMHSAKASLHDKLLVQRLLQLSGEKADWKWIKSVHAETLKGNYYWGEEQNSLYDNRVLNTLIAYEIALASGVESNELVKMRNFFLEARAKNWRNTYESACVIRAVTCSVDMRKSIVNSTLKLSGGITQSVQKFPATVETDTAEPITVTIKTGIDPMYFTAYREVWNPAPKREETKFNIETSLSDRQNLRAGKPVTLSVTVEVKHDTEYVMIEVPIPAGCSYQSKSESKTNGEIHREYYAHKTNIYCRFLKKGVYRYSIQLLPRFSGKYTLNPAVAESMYFPVLHGQNEMKSIKIE
jgi:alpha-2-macroglobulin